MELRARRTGNTVRWPGVDEVRVFGEVTARVDVPVARADDIRVRRRLDVSRDRSCDIGAAGDREAAALAEIVLYVDNDKRTRHDGSSYAVGRAGSPAERP